jgi:hypothetical protein
MRIGLVLFLLLASCANKNDKCGDKYLGLWPTADGQYSYQELKLPTLSNPYELKGAAGQIYYEAGLGPNGFKGSVAQPRYTRSNGVCVPMDVASSLGVTLYAQLEALKNFEDRLGLSHLIAWPRKVGFDIHLRTSDGMTHNNAHYISKGDAIAVIPYGLNGLPMAGNHGILAHELFHAHFQVGVVVPVNARLSALADLDTFFYPGFFPNIKPTVDDVQGADLSKPRGLNVFVLRAWNEGLADVFAAIYTKNPHFIDGSLPALAETRALDAPLIQFNSREDLTTLARRTMSPDVLVRFAYGQGALLARLVYRIATSGVETPEDFLVRIMNRLPEISPAIMTNFDSQVLSFGEVLPILLKDFPLTLAQCGQIQKMVNGGFTMERFPQCAGF